MKCSIRYDSLDASGISSILPSLFARVNIEVWRKLSNAGCLYADCVKNWECLLQTLTFPRRWDLTWLPWQWSASPKLIYNFRAKNYCDLFPFAEHCCSSYQINYFHTLSDTMLLPNEQNVALLWRNITTTQWNVIVILLVLVLLPLLVPGKTAERRTRYTGCRV